ncbi:MAG: hypothetical protein IPO08_06655 [Xanthomonadales bacterium]|nr:hypothetical protein [Xanthomonadales bacterium]
MALTERSEKGWTAAAIEANQPHSSVDVARKEGRQHPLVRALSTSSGGHQTDRARHAGVHSQRQGATAPGQPTVERAMSKGLDKKKETKKQPLKTPKEKKAEKAAKKNAK